MTPYDWADEPEAITDRALELLDDHYCGTYWTVAYGTAVSIFAGLFAALVYVLWLVAS